MMAHAVLRTTAILHTPPAMSSVVSNMLLSLVGGVTISAEAFPVREHTSRGHASLP